MITQTEKKYYTPEEYFELEETAEYKSEYHDGEIIPMTGGTDAHNTIALNFCRSFPRTIDNQSYKLYLADMRLSIPEYKRYTYPDIMIIKGKPIFERNQTIVTNPLVIVEVLSKSTYNYDKTKKFKYYRSLPSLEEYILIDQYHYSVEKYVKQTNEQWFYHYFDGQEAILTLDSVDFQISFSKLYEEVDIEPEPEIEGTEEMD